MLLSVALLCLVFPVCFSIPVCSSQNPCNVILVQDCGVAGDTNTRSILTALQSPAINLLGIVASYGDNWQTISYAHCRMVLEILGNVSEKKNIPVWFGSDRPVTKTRNETLQWNRKYAGTRWLGMYNPTSVSDVNHGPGVLAAPNDTSRGAMREGMTEAVISQTCNATEQNCRVPVKARDGPQNMVDAIMSFPGEVVLVSLAPLTDVALARMLDPRIVTKTHLWIMGAGFNSVSKDDNFPRLETNMWFDPYLSRFALRGDDNDGSNWLSTTIIPLDVTVVSIANIWEDLQNGSSSSRAAQYIVDCTSLSPTETLMYDEMTVLLLVNQETITKKSKVFVDVDTSSGANEGSTLSWTSFLPSYGLTAECDVVFGINQTLFLQQFADLMNEPKMAPTKEKICR